MTFAIARRANNKPIRALLKHDESQRAFLRHLAARVNLVNHQPFTLVATPTFFSTLCRKAPSLKRTPASISRPRDPIKSFSQTRIMSDDAYSSFLDKANQDTGAGKPSTQSKSAATRAVDTEVPAALQKVEQYYVSEADEPFEPVSLKWDGTSMPSENEFGELIGHKGEVSTVNTKEFDPKGDYKEVLQAVEKAGDGKTRIYRLETGKSRAEYYVVGLDGKGGRVVGLKAKAVES
ncbi:hypothetical protein N7G274_000818 [Stereocaulon virgatum]|uniref:Uncharacterized protein n=1 Tax=Stereocaulon virgatum TaxID=373712 RepID=A0ABR4ANK8_9LECA